MALGSTNAGGGGSGKSGIKVAAPTGATVKATLGDKVKIATENNGLWIFRNCDLGTWRIDAELNGQETSGVIEIKEEGQLLWYYIDISFHLYPDKLNLDAYGVKGKDYEVVQDDDTVIPPSDYRKFENWKVCLLTSGCITPMENGKIDVFLVAGGAGGGAGAREGDGYGGGGGYHKKAEVSIQARESRRNIREIQRWLISNNQS